MDISAATSWLSELEMEDTVFMEDCDIMGYIDEELGPILEGTQNTFSPENNSFSPTLIQGITNFDASSYLNTPQIIHNTWTTPQHHMPNNFDQYTSAAPIFLTFGQENSIINNLDNEANKNDTAATISKSSSARRKRKPEHSENHVQTERKRRAVLGERFIALSGLVPGLKKTDKTSVLGDTIKYLKQLKERVKTLEKQSSKKTMESVILVKKSHLFVEDEGSSVDSGGGVDQHGENSGNKLSLPEIEARMCGKSVLVKIQCEKQKGVVNGILEQVEKFNLAVTNTNVVAFGGLTFDITITAEMEKGFSLTMNELVRRLRVAILKIMKKA